MKSFEFKRVIQLLLSLDFHFFIIIIIIFTLYTFHTMSFKIIISSIRISLG